MKLPNMTMSVTMNMKSFVAIAATAAIMCTTIVAAPALAVPTTLTYAGVLTDADVRVEGTHDVIFELFDDDTAGTVQYSETITGLIIIDGELVAEIGNNNLDDSVLALPELWLEVTVDGTPLLPRVRLNSVPYALRAIAAQQAIEAVLAEEALSLGGILPEDVVTTTQLATQLAALGLSAGLNAGTGISISNGTVSIAPAGVGATQLAANAVTTGAIADLAVTSTKIANGAVAGEHIGPLAVDSGQLKNASVTGTQLANGSVTTTHIVNGSVGSLQLSTSAVATGNIADGAVTGVKIADGAITAVKIANATITTTQIAANAIALAQLQGSSVDGAKILNGSVTGSDVADDSITGSDITDNSIQAGDIAANQVTTSEIANGTIASSDISGGTDNIFFTAPGCGRGIVTLASTCDTLMCGTVSGAARFFDCNRTACSQVASASCSTTAAGFVFSTALSP